MGAEAKIEDYLTTQAEKHGFLCWKFKCPGTNGVPDRILIGYDHVIFVETKAPGGKPRPLQTAIHKLMRDHGANVFVIDTKPKVDKFFKDTIHTLISN